MSANPGYPGRVRVDLRLNDQQLGVIAEVLAAEGTPDTLEALLDVAVRHDMARPADPARARPRPGAPPPARFPRPRSCPRERPGRGAWAAAPA